MPLSTNDAAVLQQVFDPESAPQSEVLVDASLPQDPHVDDAAFRAIVAQERPIIQAVEAALAQAPAAQAPALAAAAAQLQALAAQHPAVGALHNDLAQTLRLQHTDAALARALVQDAGAAEGAAVLDALARAIALLSPKGPGAAVSPAQGRVLAQAHMQRAALRRTAAAAVGAGEWRGWGRARLEEAASQDLFVAGRYGNQIGRALAVHTNPTAKLCGEMVKDAMKREMAMES